MQQNQITSPYNFVPMAENVHYPEWQNINLDSPIENGLSGTIEYTLTAHSPLLIGDKQTPYKEGSKGSIVHFFQTPDQQYAIPGSTVKGMIRNWLEIATHSRMSIMNDNWLSYRDLRNTEYRDKLTETIDNQTYEAKTKAGWLRFNNGQWELRSASLWRVENSEIQKTFNIRINDKESQNIYKKLNGIRSVDFKANSKQEHPHSSGNRLIYAKATNVTSSASGAQGYLIVTGQVSNKKHMNFIFSAPTDLALQFNDESVIKSFLDINLEREDFQYLKNLNHEHGIPVFYIEEQGYVTQMGMAQMFRFPYKFSVGQLRHDSHLDTDEKRRDFAELLFGDIKEGSESLKGRVSFSLAKCTDPSIKPLTLKPTVLGSPRNSFYPAYIDQSNAKKGYKTYNQNDAKLAGFKRYAIRKNFNESALQDPPANSNRNNEVNYKVAVQMQPLPQNTTFTGKVRFHNLNPAELGALLFALNLDQNAPEYFHHMGMGKPYGLGKVKFSDLSIKLAQSDALSEIENYLTLFSEYAAKKTNSSQTIIQLLMNQSEATFNEADLKYPAFPKGFIDLVNTKGQAKLVNLANRVEAQQKVQAEEKRKEIIKAKEEEKRAELNSGPGYRAMLESEFGDENGKLEVNKAMFQTLCDKPVLWETLNGKDKKELAVFLTNADYYKTYKAKYKKQVKKKKTIDPNFDSLNPLFGLTQ